MKAISNGKIIAESTDTIIIEGNHYFPVASVSKEYLQDSRTITSCFWKGLASYYNVKVNGEVKEDAAWYYPEPSEAAQQIKNYIAFWKGVEVTD